MKTVSKQCDYLPSKEKCVYTSCYCEENVWMLCDFVRKNHPDHLSEFFIVFISNSTQTTPLWMQKAGNPDEQHLVIWDYHVILVHKNERSGDCSVYDLDTILPFPSSFEDYFLHAIRDNSFLKSKKYHRKFRVVNAPAFLSSFASDRSHMRGQDGSWLQSPPSYECIRTNTSTNNLKLFLRMEENNFVDNEQIPGIILNDTDNLKLFFNLGTN